MRDGLIHIILYIVISLSLSCNKTDLGNELTFKELKLYNIEVQKIKKIHDYFALISPHKIIFLNSDGDKQFSYNDSLFQSVNTYDFKFTDIVQGPGSDIFILGTEILKNQEFNLDLIRIDVKGQEIWEQPKHIMITNLFQTDSADLQLNSIQNFTIKENGYALASYINNELIVVINYQTLVKYAWRYRIISFSDNGEVNHDKDYASDKYLKSWTYLIDKMPDNTLTIIRGDDVYLDIIQYDPITFEIIKVHTIGSGINDAMFTAMHPWTSDEVILTGHADRRNNKIVAENFDIFCIRYNYKSNKIIDSLFYGLVNNEELSYDSYILGSKVYCIGTQRGDFLSTPSFKSNLLEINFNFETRQRDSVVYIQDEGYEGLFAEPVNNLPTEQKVLGYKLDISGKQNIQGFYMQLKNP